MNNNVLKSVFFAGVVLVAGIVAMQVVYNNVSDGEVHPVIKQQQDIRSSFSVIKDPESGCEYIVTKNSTIPRLDRHGDHICGED